METVEKDKQLESQEIEIEEKCDIVGHENYDLVAVCLDENCQSEKRLCCSKCLVFLHGDHTESCLFLSDIKTDSKNTLENWSKDTLGKKVEKYLNENENIEQEIDTMVNNLIKTVIEEISQAKNTLRRKRIEGKTQIQKTAKYIQGKYEFAYDIEYLKKIIQDFMQDNLSEEELNKKLEDIIKTREEIEELNKKNQLVATYPCIDKEFLQEKQNQILDIISGLTNTIRIPNTWNFIIPKFGNNYLIKEQEAGKSFIFSKGSQNQLVYGNQVFKSGIYTWKIWVKMDTGENQQENEQNGENNNNDNNNNGNNNNNDHPFGDPNQGGFGFGGNQFGFGGNQQNFNHQDYQNLQNLIIGVVGDNKKDQQGTYQRNFEMNSQDVQGLDIIREQQNLGQMIDIGQGQGQIHRRMSQVFREKRNEGFEIHLTLNLEENKFSITDKAQECNYEAQNLNNKTVAWRPFVCSIRSKVVVTLKETLCT